jgi:Fur family ferric uptake transcriptional regulator
MKSYRRILQNAQLKVTTARQAVLEFFAGNDKPVDVSELLVYLKEREIDADKATVYRILEVFYEKGIIARMEFGEGKFRYELAGADHHHLICERCGAIEDISDCHIDTLEKEIKKKKGFIVKRHSLEFYGACRQCQL